MPRYESTGAARCSAIAVRAISARAPIASRRPLTEQKIHAGKKEPKIAVFGRMRATSQRKRSRQRQTNEGGKRGHFGVDRTVSSRYSCQALLICVEHRS